MTLVLALAALPAAAEVGKAGCFDVIAARNSPATRRVFAARRCQGGGVTWAPILRALVSRRGPIAPVRAPIPGLTGDVAILAGRSRFAIDEEGDAARFCAEDQALLDGIRADYARLNRDPAELRRAMAQAPAHEMECEDEGGKAALPPPLPVPLPSREEAAVEGARIERIKALIQREPAWCFAKDDPERRVGVLRFLPDGRVRQTRPGGDVLGEGAVVWPRPGSGDDRLEVVLRTSRFPGGAGLLHLDIGPSGRLGYNYANERRTRLDLIPGSLCLGGR